MFHVKHFLAPPLRRLYIPLLVLAHPLFMLSPSRHNARGTGHRNR
jgi:hypothetical protein